MLKGIVIQLLIWPNNRRTILSSFELYEYLAQKYWGISWAWSISRLSVAQTNKQTNKQHTHTKNSDKNQKGGMFLWKYLLMSRSSNLIKEDIGKINAETWCLGVILLSLSSADNERFSSNFSRFESADVFKFRLVMFRIVKSKCIY